MRQASPILRKLDRCGHVGSGRFHREIARRPSRALAPGEACGGFCQSFKRGLAVAVSEGGTRFSKVPNQPTFPSSSSQNFCSPSISRLQNRLVSISQRPCSPAPTRSLNRNAPLPFMALFGHGAMSDLSPFSGVWRKSDFGAVRSAFDPERTSSVRLIVFCREPY